MWEEYQIITELSVELLFDIHFMQYGHQLQKDFFSWTHLMEVWSISFKLEQWTQLSNTHANGANFNALIPSSLQLR